jgi:phosphatidylglycerol lysyltransferase
MRRVRRIVHRHPATLALGALLVLLAVATAPLRMLAEEAFRGMVGTGLGPLLTQHSAWTPFTYGLFADNPLELATALVAVAALVGWSERLMGAWRTLLAFLLLPAIGAGAGMLPQAADVLGLGGWDDGGAVIDPLAPAIGALLTASAFADRLWRRRIRLLGFAGLLLMTLYSATSVDLFRLLTGAAGLVLGLILVPDARKTPRWARSSAHEARSLLAALVLASAVGPFVALASGLPWGPLHPLGLLLRPLGAAGTADCSRAIATPACMAELALARLGGPGPVLLSVLPLLLLALSAYGMLRGRRVAAWLAIGVNLLLAALAAVYYALLPLVPDDTQFRLPDSEAAVVPVTLSVLLPLALAVRVAVSLPSFPVAPSRLGLRRFLGTVLVTAVACIVGYVGVGSLVLDQFEPPVTGLRLLADLPERLVPVGFLALRPLETVPSGSIAELLYDGVGPAFWGALFLASSAVIFDSAGAAKGRDLGRVRAMLRQEGPGSLSFMATWQGNEYWFGPCGEVAVAYRLVSGVAITTGAPIGPAERRTEAALGFARFCDEHGWVPVFYGIGDELRDALDERGWQATPIGDDAVLDPAAFTLVGKRSQDIRTSLNRARKLGVTDEWSSWEQLGLTARSQIEAISEEWVAGRNLPEMGFTLGGIDELQDPEVRLLLAVAPTGRIEAVTSWLPTYREGEVVGWTLDLMRRRPDSMNGVVEFLLARMLQRARYRELEFVSLSAAPLARVAEQTDAPDLTTQVLGFLGRRLETLYGFRSLLAFKLKFQPEFRPLHLAYPDPVLLPAVGIAIARAYLPAVTVQQAVTLTRSLVFSGDPGRAASSRVPTPH